MGTVTVRPATVDDVPLLQHWDTQPHVIAATGDDDVIDWAVELTLDPDWSRAGDRPDEPRP